MLRAFIFALALLSSTINICAADFSNESLLNELDSISKIELWPGYNPSSYPIAIYNGTDTILYRYPKQPEGFTPVAGKPDTFIFNGRHPGVVANSSSVIDDIRVATVLLEPKPNRSLKGTAGLLVHEIFHVYQRENHPDWGANEASLFSYPFTDEKVYHLRLLESKSLLYSMRETDASKSAGWLLSALAYRTERFNLMDDASVQYERKQEINEGLAQYVQDKSLDNSPVLRFPDTLWTPENIRTRTYTTGQVFAHFLDVYLPAWKEMLNEGVSAPLDIMLLVAIKTNNVQPLKISDKERLEFEELSKHNVSAYKNLLANKKNDFQASPGWKVKIEVLPGANLLALRGFDPLNVLNLGDGEIYHARMLNLGNSQGSLSMINLQAISYGPNAHPLFHGVRNVEIAGLSKKPEITESGQALTIKADGFDFSFSNAGYEIVDGNLIYVKMHPPTN